jgi:hypothetical protein
MSIHPGKSNNPESQVKKAPVLKFRDNVHFHKTPCQDKNAGQPAKTADRHSEESKYGRNV